MNKIRLGYYNLIPIPTLASGIEPNNPIVQDLDTIWTVHNFKIQRSPIFLGDVNSSCSMPIYRGLRFLDMPIKMRGANEYRIPKDLSHFQKLLQKVVNNEHAMLDDETIKKYYTYLTIDQSWVKPYSTQRKSGCHVDGFQGARIIEKTEISHNYLIMDKDPTAFYPQVFDLSALDENIHNFFIELDRQANEEIVIYAPLNTPILIDAYTVHRSTITRRGHYRTFVRITYDVKKFDRQGNSRNPYFDYDWKMVDRNIHSSLVAYTPKEFVVEKMSNMETTDD